MMNDDQPVRLDDDDDDDNKMIMRLPGRRQRAANYEAVSSSSFVFRLRVLFCLAGDRTQMRKSRDAQSLVTHDEWLMVAVAGSGACLLGLRSREGGRLDLTCWRRHGTQRSIWGQKTHSAATTTSRPGLLARLTCERAAGP